MEVSLIFINLYYNNNVIEHLVVETGYFTVILIGYWTKGIFPTKLLRNQLHTTLLIEIISMYSFIKLN